MIPVVSISGLEKLDSYPQGQRFRGRKDYGALQPDSSTSGADFEQRRTGAPYGWCHGADAWHDDQGERIGFVHSMVEKGIVNLLAGLDGDDKGKLMNSLLPQILRQLPIDKLNIPG